MKKQARPDPVLALIIAQKRAQQALGLPPAAPLGHPGFDITAWRREQEAIREQQRADKAAAEAKAREREHRGPPPKRRKKQPAVAQPPPAEPGAAADLSFGATSMDADIAADPPTDSRVSISAAAASLPAVSTAAPAPVQMVMPMPPAAPRISVRKAAAAPKPRDRAMPFSLSDAQARPQPAGKARAAPPVLLPPAVSATLDAIVGNVAAVKQVRAWAALKPSARPCLLLEGPSGCGKSFLAHALARALGLRLIAVDSESMHAEQSYIGLIVKTASTRRPVPACVLADDVDVQLALRPDKTQAAEPAALDRLAVLRSPNAVILTCADLSDARLRAFAKHRDVKCVKMNPVFASDMEKHILAHAKRRGMIMTQTRAHEIAQFARGDLHQMFAALSEAAAHRRLFHQRGHEMDFFQGAAALLHRNPLTAPDGAPKDALNVATLEGHVADNSERAIFALEHNVPLLLSAWAANSHAESADAERARLVLPLEALASTLDALCETDVYSTVGWNQPGVHDLVVARTMSALSEAYRTLPQLERVRVQCAYPPSLSQHFQIKQAAASGAAAHQQNAHRAATHGNARELDRAFLGAADVLDTTGASLRLLEAALCTQDSAAVDQAARTLAQHAHLEGAKSALFFGACTQPSTYARLNTKNIAAHYERGAALLLRSSCTVPAAGKAKARARAADATSAGGKAEGKTDAKKKRAPKATAPC